jgi:hypothetical protein
MASKLDIPIRLFKSHPLGFLARMHEKRELLILMRGGFWRLTSLPGWHTDVDVVMEADRRGYLRKLSSPGSLDARALTDVGIRFAEQLCAEFRVTATGARQKRQLAEIRKAALKPQESATPELVMSWMASPKAVFLPDLKGVWHAKSEFARCGVDTFNEGRSLLLKCNFCRKAWSPVARSPHEYWRCPNGCNSSIAIDIELREG